MGKSGGNHFQTTSRYLAWLSGSELHFQCMVLVVLEGEDDNLIIKTVLNVSVITTFRAFLMLHGKVVSSYRLARQCS